MKGLKMRIFVVLVTLAGLLFAVVDINSADKKELTTLKGIGAKKAEAILKYRKDHCFKSVDELTKIKGIGKKFIEKNRDNLKVGECKK